MAFFVVGGFALRLLRLKKNEDFSEVIRTGKSYVSHLIVLYVKKVDDASPCRVGFSVGKKVGSAVRRNYYKRVLREIVRLHAPRIRPGFDCVVIARPAIQKATFAEIEHHLLTLFARARVLVKEDER